jgi:alkanesulfonate monooxygenase SsuD/methylene tetrahydromethanopterin reductase-like flavin-dependent oxidoreductase (luciferase family)
LLKFDYYILNTYVAEQDGPPRRLYASWAEQVRAAEAHGYEAVWLTEHHFRPFGGMMPNPQLLLASLAASTGRIRLGTAVSILPLHHPVRIAEDMAMLDVISGGRLNVGVGLTRVATLHHFGGTPQPLVLESMRRFAEEVAPTFSDG